MDPLLAAKEAIGPGLSAAMQDFESRGDLSEFSLPGFLIYFYLEGNIHGSGSGPSTVEFQKVVEMSGNVAECGAAVAHSHGSDGVTLLPLAIGGPERDAAEIKAEIGNLWRIGSQGVSNRLDRFRQIEGKDPETLSDMFLLTSYAEVGADLRSQASRARALAREHLPFNQVWAAGAAAFVEGIAFVVCEPRMYSKMLVAETLPAVNASTVDDDSAQTTGELNAYRVTLCQYWARHCRPNQLDLITEGEG